MAKFYSKAKSNIGSLSGTIIMWPIELSSKDPNEETNKQKLPSGYLKCDGSKYNAVNYPELAVICGTGTNCKFVRRDINGDPLTELSDSEFVVPDLGSKYPRPVPGADSGTYNAISVLTKSGVEKRRSGIGIDATSTVGETVRVNYTGKFIVPSQTILLKGKPSWSKGTSNSGYTDSETVDSTSIHPHMHMSTTNRCRIKPRNVSSNGQDPGGGNCFYRTASTINIETWLENTRINNSSSYPKGSNQPPCWAIASAKATNGVTNPNVTTNIGIFARELDYHNACFQGAGAADLHYNCLLNTNTTYQLSQDVYALGSNPTGAKVDTIFSVIGICGYGSDIAGEGGQNGTWNVSGTVSSDNPGLYQQNAPGVPNDWLGRSLYDVVPLNSNGASVSAVAYPQVTNLITEVDELDQPDGDPTSHNHKIVLTKEDHTFAIKTDPFLLDPDSLNTQLTITTDTAASLDSVTAPYIILEYLIKI
jgi:hypothetical protein